MAALTPILKPEADSYYSYSYKEGQGVGVSLCLVFIKLKGAHIWWTSQVSTLIK